MSLFSSRTTITCETAQALVEIGLTKLTEMGVPSNVAIVDAQGYLIAHIRMDGAQLPSIEHAINKAYTSALFKQSTAALATDAQPGGSLYGLNLTLDQRVIVFAGGEPLVHQGNVVGAIGVSGGTAEQDQQAATHIVKAFEQLAASQH